MNIVSKTLKGLLGIRESNDLSKGINVLSHDTYQGEDFIFEGFSVVNGKGNWNTKDNSNCKYAKYVRAYLDCPPLSAIINLTAEALTKGEDWVLKKGGKTKNDESNTSNAKKIRKILEIPNKHQTGTLFKTELVISVRLFGWAIIYVKKSIGYDNVDAESMHIIPANQIEFEYNYNLTHQNRGWDSIKNIYAILNGGQRIKLVKENCYIIKDTLPSFDIGSIVPTSRCETIKQPIQNIIDGLESRGVLLNERGMRGMITNETVDSNSFIPVNPDEKDEIDKAYKTRYGLKNGQNQIFFSNKSLKWQAMQLPTKDLMLFEEHENSAGMICDAFGFPKQVLADMGKGTTFSNLSTASRNLILNAVIPVATNIYTQLDAIFEARNYDLVVQCDFSGLPELQPDQKEKDESFVRRAQGVRILFETGLISKNEARKMMDQDTVTGWDEEYYNPLSGKATDIGDMQLNDGVSMNTVNNEGSLNQAI